MACVLEKLGKPQQALAELEKCVARRKEVLGSNHPDTIKSVSTMAKIHLQEERLETAQRLYEECLALCESNNSLHHAALKSSTIQSLETIYESQGKPDASQEMIERATEVQFPSIIHEGIRGHSATMKDTKNVKKAVDKLKLEALQAAESNFTKAVDIKTVKYGHNDPRTASALVKLAHVYYESGKSEESHGLLMKAHETYTNTVGSEHPGKLFVYSIKFNVIT